MKRLLSIFCLSLLISGCNEKTEEKKDITVSKTITEKTVAFNLDKANYLYHFAYDCIDQEYPNKLNQVIGDASYLKTPKELHPSFYGCFDWHSSVHGHWTLVNLLIEFPEFDQKDAIIKKLKANITKENIENEVKYFDDVHNKTFERTYGWAWLLKLAESLNEYKTEEGKKLAQDLAPLTKLIEDKFIEFLNKLNYPIRVGEHPNTAFGMSFALDYAKKYNKDLEAVIIKKAKEFYYNDANCPLSWEPGGFDFLSPCLQEAALMLKVLPKNEYIIWLDTFMPGFRNNPSENIEVVEVVDKSDGKMAHLDGLNFSRAWCLYEMGKVLNNNNMITLANTHFNSSYSKMDSGEYAGAHWLASFAAYALKAGK
ncbi:DUF2891 domain-containing protein [uncultured Lacinutrix sp.]|uniref:DUF2891 domain-containing protein n=1 Tax=uncultured Lacinutrix sp. TaxID=574032 RepID=UPI002617CB80|nr:DUF2891 domain-containing protein [uncultured Lacinutrix sp.]